MKNFWKNIVILFAFLIIFFALIILYIDYVCMPFSNGSDLVFSSIIIGGFLAVDIALRIEERFKIFDKITVNKTVKYSILIIAGLILIFQILFRYEYKTYKGSLPYTAEVIKIDKLTGQSSVTILDARSNKK